MNKVNDETLDVRSVVILIRHDHEVTITQRLDILFGVDGSEFEPHDLHDIHDFFILHNLSVGGIPDVEGLTLEGEDAVVVPSNDR
jgi:hypothetical protein